MRQRRAGIKVDQGGQIGEPRGQKRNWCDLNTYRTIGDGEKTRKGEGEKTRREVEWSEQGRREVCATRQRKFFWSSTTITNRPTTAV